MPRTRRFGLIHRGRHATGEITEVWGTMAELSEGAQKEKGCRWGAATAFRGLRDERIDELTSIPHGASPGYKHAT
jgi:hypothetical protein